MGGGAAIGAVLGGLGGVVTGFMMGGPVGAAVGMGIGATSGGLQGDQVDKAKDQDGKQRAENARQADLAKNANYRQGVNAIASVAKKGIGEQIGKLRDLNAKNTESDADAQRRLKPYQLVKNDAIKRAETAKVFLGVRNSPSYGKVAKVS